MHEAPNTSGCSEGAFASQLATGYRWLRFEPELEGNFQRKLNRQSVQRVRLALYVGLLLLGIDAVLDCIVSFSGWLAVLQEGIVVLCVAPALLLIARILRLRADTIPVGRLTGSVVVLACLGLFLARVLVVDGEHSVRLEAFGLLAVFNFFLLGLPFIRACGGAVLIIIAQLAAELVLGVPPISYIHSTFYLFAMVVACGVGCYANEYALRGSYLTSGAMTELSERDELTQLNNRRVLNRALDNLLAQARRENVSLTVMLFDIDHFKSYNDTNGHVAGDVCLRRVANELVTVARRPLDLVVRFGGEEFVIVLYDADAQVVAQLAQECRARIAALEIQHSAAPAGFVTISGGVVWMVPDTDTDAKSLLQRADAAMYEAKLAGRDQVSVVILSAGDTEPVVPTKTCTAVA